MRYTRATSPRAASHAARA